METKQLTYRDRLHKVIPGGAHTYSRGDDQFPSNAPQILQKGKGAYVWDPEGNKFLDYGMALRAITLGYSNDKVNKAAFVAIENGVNLQRASTVELDAAELLVDLIPGAEMVKFAKNGSTATTAAIKIARAYTGKKLIAFCAEHPFYSYDDWFIGSTIMSRGVPKEIQSLSLKFNYNDINSLTKLFEEYPGQIAAVLFEPATLVGPKDNFLHKVKELCKKNGTVFILDEMITGFRFHLQGAQTLYGVEPDMSTFGKGMANGFSVAALVGKREFMSIGGIKNPGAERVFLTSTTHGAEMVGLGAFIKTVEIYKQHNVIEHLWQYGKTLTNGMNAIAKELGIAEFFYTEGYDCSPNYVTKDKTGEVSLAFRTLFAQEMIKNGVMMPYIGLSYAHGDSELNITLAAVKKALTVYKQAIEKGYENYLNGPIIKPVFRKFN